MTIIREINTLMSKARSKYYSNYSDEFSTLIENPKFIDLLKDSSISIKAALDHTGLLLRGLINLVDDDNRIGYTQPKTRTDLRNPKAATYEMMNLYENLDFFQNWPDRYRGIFMTNSKENAYKFSDTIGLVFPRNGANIGRTKDDFNMITNLGLFLGHFPAPGSLLLLWRFRQRLLEKSIAHIDQKRAAPGLIVDID